MFNATHIIYDGVDSATYGLMLGDFEGSNQESTPILTPNISILPLNQGNRFVYIGKKYDSPPQLEFTLYRETPMTGDMRRSVLSWLTGKPGYKTLVIPQPELAGYTYRCIFSDIDMLYINGNCYGVTVTAQFDSQYQYGTPIVHEYDSEGSQQTFTLSYTETSDTEYVSPMIQFCPKAILTGGADISITTAYGDEFSVFSFTGLTLNETVMVDNENRIITATVTKRPLQKFNMGWLRLKPGSNTLSISINGTAKLTIPQYVKIGF